MKTVFVVYTDDCEGYSLDGVYTTFNLAEQLCKELAGDGVRYNDYVVVELKLDEPMDLLEGKEVFRIKSNRFDNFEVEKEEQVFLREEEDE